MFASASTGGRSPRTRESYLRSVRQLIDHFAKDPMEITEGELEDYFLFRRNDSRWKPAALSHRYAATTFRSRTVPRMLVTACKVRERVADYRLPLM